MLILKFAMFFNQLLIFQFAFCIDVFKDSGRSRRLKLNLF
jgi:hypothetical protein